MVCDEGREAKKGRELCDGVLVGVRGEGGIDQGAEVVDGGSTEGRQTKTSACHEKIEEETGGGERAKMN